MIYSVRGKLVLRETELAVVECGGVGYACRTTLQTLAALGEKGSEVMLYTYLHVREDCMELFGFATKQELNCFKMLISVSGVGPKAALSILSDVFIPYLLIVTHFLLGYTWRSLANHLFQ